MRRETAVKGTVAQARDAVLRTLGTPAPGPAGTAATVAVGTTTTGAAGTSATVTNSGNSSAAVLNFTIPQGIKGDTGSPTAYELRGTGIPNGVVTAAVGTYYTDTAGTNGAWRWLKKSGTGDTGWECIVGDTGWRRLTSTLINGWAGGTVVARRVGSSVEMRYNDLKTDTATAITALPLPDGFKCALPTVVRSIAYTIAATPTIRRVALLSTLDISYAATPAETLYGGVSYLTGDPWPTTLPGTPV